MILENFGRPGYFEQVFRYTTQAAEHMSAASQAWLREIEASTDLSMVSAGPITPDDLEAFREAEQRLGTSGTERQGIFRAAVELGLGYGDRPRIEGMLRSIWLRKWQPVGILALCDFQRDLTGALLCDTMGLGKTIQMVGHILAVGL
jgi:SNF2 family DNA or RNA helicase